MVLVESYNRKSESGTLKGEAIVEHWGVIPFNKSIAP